jgi:ferredoxin
MEVSVSEPRCTGQGRCWNIAPAVFEPDDEGFNAGRGGVVEVPGGHEAAARTAVSSCPEAALRIAKH